MLDCIHWASAYGDLELLEKILKHHPSLVNKVNRYGMTPLHAACFHGHLESVKLLLKSGADPNISSSSAKFTFPLHLAATRMHKEICKVMIVEGRADASLRDYLGQTPLVIARSLCLENDSLAREDEEKQELIQALQESIASVEVKSTRPFTFVSGHARREPTIFYNETDMPSPTARSADFFRSETTIKRT